MLHSPQRCNSKPDNNVGKPNLNRLHDQVSEVDLCGRLQARLSQEMAGGGCWGPLLQFGFQRTVNCPVGCPIG